MSPISNSHRSVSIYSLDFVDRSLISKIFVDTDSGQTGEHLVRSTESYFELAYTYFTGKCDSGKIDESG